MQHLLALALCLAPAVLANLDAPNPAKAHRELARNVVHNIVARDTNKLLEARSDKKKRCRVKSTTLVPHHSSTASGSTPTGGTGGGSGGSGGSGGGTTVPTGPSDWALKLTHKGNTFFDGWDFWNLADPTHGVVEFLSRDDAQRNNLIEINDAGNAIMRVETTPNVNGRNRRSIRIHDQHVFNGGLVIMDSVHMPTGCGTWPAWWSNGPDWPNKGEIDIIEGVHDNDINQSSIHTGSGCRIPENNFGATATLVGGANCASYESNNGGCGQLTDGPRNNYGKSFNENGGGVYALKWDDSGISVYFFPRGSIPSDITGNAPHPENWGTPVANWPSTQCNPYQYFIDHIAIFDTTLCGDWAGNVWNNIGSTGKSCAQITNYPSCEAFVANEGAQFAEAYWEVKYVQYYEHK